MQKKQQAFAYYQGAVQEGKTMKQMAEERGIHESSVYISMIKFGLLSLYREQHPDDQPSWKIQPRTDVREIRKREYADAIGAGKTIESIAAEQGLTESYVHQQISRFGLLSLYRQHHPHVGLRPYSISPERKNEYKSLIEEGHTIEEIAGKLTVSANTVWGVISRIGLTALYREQHPLQRKGIKQNNKRRTYERLEEFVTQGVSQGEIAAHFGVRPQMISLLIRQRNLDAQWEAAQQAQQKERGSEQTDLHRERQNFVSFLYQVTLQRAHDDPTMEKAVQYYFSRRYTPASGSLERYYALFQVYDHAQNKGKKLSVNELAKKSGISFPHVSRILKTVGEEPMYGMKDRHVLTSREKKIVQNAIRMDTLLGYKEMETVTGISWFVFNRTAHREGIQHARARNLLYENFNQNEKVTYKKALDLYEALDAGFSAAEARAYADIKTDKGYAIALEKRTDLEAKVAQFKQHVGLEKLPFIEKRKSAGIRS